MYRVKVRDTKDSSDEDLKDIIKLENMKYIMELTGISSFTVTGYTYLLEVSMDFIKKILTSAMAYMHHRYKCRLCIEEVCYSLKHHNLKFYGIGKTCLINDCTWHPTELLTTESIFDYPQDKTQEPGTFYKRIDLLKKYEQRGFDEESSYDGDDILENDENCSTTSSNLGVITNFETYKPTNEVREERREELKDAQEILDELEEDECPLGETDDEEEIEIPSSYWTCTKDVYYNIRVPKKATVREDDNVIVSSSSDSSVNDDDSPGQNCTYLSNDNKRMFARQSIDKMFHKRVDRCFQQEISPAAVAILHQVFEDYLYEQCTTGQLRLKIENEALQWRVHSLEGQVENLKQDNLEKRKRMREASESLQSHFDVIDVTNKKRRVSPS